MFLSKQGCFSKSELQQPTCYVLEKHSSVPLRRQECRAQPRTNSCGMSKEQVAPHSWTRQGKSSTWYTYTQAQLGWEPESRAGVKATPTSYKMNVPQKNSPVLMSGKTEGGSQCSFLGFSPAILPSPTTEANRQTTPAMVSGSQTQRPAGRWVMLLKQKAYHPNWVGRGRPFIIHPSAPTFSDWILWMRICMIRVAASRCGRYHLLLQEDRFQLQSRQQSPQRRERSRQIMLELDSSNTSAAPPVIPAWSNLAEDLGSPWDTKSRVWPCPKAYS